MPDWIAVDAAEIPQELKSRPQWVGWNGEEREGKWTKIPYQAGGHFKAKVNEPRTWAPFSAALAAYQAGDHDGIGYVLTPEDPFAFADLDHCVSLENDGIASWALEIVKSLDSYTEVSPSGSGLRIAIKAKLPAGRRREGRIELYDSGRFCTFTGARLPMSPATVEDRQGQIDALHRAMFPDTKRIAVAGEPSDEELIQQARNAANGEKFSALWDGNTEAYASQSEADQALANNLVWWCQGDTIRADRLFRQSGLFRPDKWDKRHHANGDTYGQRTLANAFTLWREHEREKTEPQYADTRHDRGQIVSWQQLQGMHFEPLRWLLDSIIPEVGLTVLGGKPKVGKSWLALQAAGAIGVGDEIFGRRAKRTRVLYFCLEDRNRRIKGRANAQELADDADIHFGESLLPLDQGGMEELERLIADIEPGFVVIDTLASAKTGKIDENSAGPMADMLNALQRLAHTHNLSMFVVAHHRKGASESPGEDLRGSNAISAAADMVLSLVRKPPAYLLSIEARDTEDAEYRMTFEDFRWRLHGDAKQMAEAEANAEALEALSRIGESDAGTVAREIGASRQSVMRRLKWLEFNKQLVSRVERATHGGIRILYRIGSDYDRTVYGGE